MAWRKESGFDYIEFWSWKDNLSVSLNLGVIGEGGGLDETINEDGDSKLHASAVYRF